MQSKWHKKLEVSKFTVYIVLAIVFIFFSIALNGKGFIAPRNLLNILRQTAMVSVMAVAGVFVLGAGQIDLTVGSTAAMSAMFSALVLQATDNILFAVIIALLFGVFVGCINGLLVTKLKLPSFLATLGMMQAIRGMAMWITDTAAVPIKNQIFNNVFGTGYVGKVSVLILWTIFFYIIGFILFNKTRFGRHALATGGNELASKYSGLKTEKIKMMIFMMSGRYSFGDGDEMSVIASVVLGGAAMSGGTGSMIGALAGSLLMGMINNALILAGLSSAQQKIVNGAIIIFAVALSNIVQNKKRK